MAVHVDDELAEFALGGLGADERRTVSAHLESCARCSGQLKLIEREVAAPRQVGGSDRGLDELMSRISGATGLQHFAPQIAQLFDLGIEAARALVAQLDDEAAWRFIAPGLHVLLIRGGPRCAGGLTGFLRLSPGAEFPHHRHTGREEVLVLQGGYVDSIGKEWWRGQVDVNESGSEHVLRALQGVPCIVAALLFGENPLAQLGRLRR